MPPNFLKGVWNQLQLNCQFSFKTYIFLNINVCQLKKNHCPSEPKTSESNRTRVKLFKEIGQSFSENLSLAQKQCKKKKKKKKNG